MISPGFSICRFVVATTLVVLLMSWGWSTHPSLGQKAPPQRPPDEQQAIAVNQRQFKIPFSIGRQSDVVQVILQVSTDRGRSWQVYQRQNAGADGFPFHCQTDGEYWFALQTIDRSGVATPATIYRPQMAVVVDTVQPQFEFEVRPDAAGRIVGQWSATDSHLQVNSLVIQFRGIDEQAWQNVPTTLPMSSNDEIFQSQLAWWPPANTPSVVVRAQIGDAAGNVTEIQRQLVLPPASGSAATHAAREMSGSQQNSITGSRPAVGRADKPAQDPYGRYQPSGVPTALARSTQQSPTSPPARPNQSAQTNTSSVNWPSVSVGQQPGTSVAQGSTAAAGGQSVARADRDGFQPHRRVEAPGNNVVVGVGSTSGSHLPNAGSPQNETGRQRMQMTARNASSVGATEAGTPRSPLSALSPGQLEDLKSMSRPLNSDRFQIDYEVDAIGPDGLKTVEVWMTRDGGRNWRRWATDEDLRSPVDVQVDGEGIFGFRVVIISNDGLRAKPPQRGDAADMWVHVDLIPPIARITAAPFGRDQQAGYLLIQWTARDANLASRPIQLQYSSRPDGPWTTIATGVDNIGTFAWKPEAGVPDQVFLRLEARDEAGNVCRDQLDRPVDISGLAPRGHIRSITPIPRSGN